MGIISSHSQLLSLSQETNQSLKTIIMNAFAFIILSLAAIATAAPGGCRGKRSPGWCMNKSSGGASSRGAPALKSIAETAAATPAKVIATDIMTSNGVVHLVDTVF